MIYKHQTKRLCNIKNTKGRVVGIKGFILNRFDRRRVNKLVAIFGYRRICLHSSVHTSKFYLLTCERISYCEYDHEYEVVFYCTDDKYRSFIVVESLWNNLLKFSNDSIYFDAEYDDLLFLKTLDLGCCTLNEI